MTLRELTEEELPVYDRLALNHGTVFNRLDWIKLFKGRMKPMGLFDGVDEMIGGVTLYSERRLGLNVLRRAPYTPMVGPFLYVRSESSLTILETWRAALTCLEEYIAGKKYALVMLPFDPKIKDALPFFWQKYKVIPKYTYIIDLKHSIEEILKNMAQKRRQNISKAKKDGIRIEFTEDYNIVRQLVMETFKRREKELDASMMDAVLFDYATASNSFAFTAFRGETPIATCFFIHDKKTSYRLLSGYRADLNHNGASPLADVVAMEYAQKIGIEHFDFEGSVMPGIERYFRDFGCPIYPYLTVNKALLPIEMLLKFRNRELF